MKFKYLAKPFNGLVENRRAERLKRFKAGLEGFKKAINAFAFDVSVNELSSSATKPSVRSIVNTAFERRFMGSKFLSPQVLSQPTGRAPVFRPQRGIRFSL